MVTGRTSLRSPEYSPISSSVNDVRATSSRFHCRPATVLVTRMSVVAPALAMAAAPTSVFPAPHGRTTTPEPPAQKPSTPSAWEARSSHPAWSSSMACAPPPRLGAPEGGRLAVDVARGVLGGPADLEQHLLETAALGGVHRDGVVVD